MPEYPYLCHNCEHEFNIIKSIRQIDDQESCPQCNQHDLERLIAKSNLERSALGQPYYEPALGCIIKGKGHKQQILKDRGLEEVGTTNPDTMYKDLEAQREKRMAREWDEL